MESKLRAVAYFEDTGRNRENKRNLRQGEEHEKHRVISILRRNKPGMQNHTIPCKPYTADKEQGTPYFYNIIC